MAARGRTPQAEGQVPLENKVFREFQGLNTQAARQAIAPEQFFWIENVMPIGLGNMRALPQNSSVLQTLTAENVTYAKEFNISNVPYMFFATTSGALYQVRLSDGAKTQIIASGTYSSTGVQIAQWKNDRILIIDPNGGYRDCDGATLTNLGGTSSSPTSGTCIATYAGRVWIVNGSANRTISYSNSAAYNDFGGAGGSTTMTDEVLTSKIFQLFPANNFLYYFGSDSVSVISDVQVVSGVTTFSNTNISANSGSDLPMSIIAYFRAIWYMNRSGIFALYGATPRKASDDLDGIFQNIDFTMPITAGTVVLYNILCAAFLFTYNDPTLGARKLMAVYFNKKWMLASQAVALTIMATSHGTSDTLYGTTGAAIYKLFGDTTAAISQTVKTAFWDFNDFISIKQAMRVGVEGTLPATSGNLSVTVDSESASEAPTTPFAGTFAFTWFNSANAIFSWTNSLAQTFTWIVAGYIWFQGDVENNGHYLGITTTSTTPGNIYNGFQLQFRKLPAGWGT